MSGYVYTLSDSSASIGTNSIDSDSDSGLPATALAHTKFTARRGRSYNMSDHASTRSASRGAPALDWLQKPTVATRRTHAKHLQEHQAHSGLLRLATAVGRRDSAQEVHFSKLYLFVLDATPQGLVGPLGHIAGNDVMTYLLSHKGEKAPSRHRLATQANAAFKQLEAWMGQAKTWKEAKAQAPDAGSKKKSAGLAPGLYSPEGMLAILVLAHPEDDKFKNWVTKKLEIDWMLEPRDSLDVRKGFWKGVHKGNLASVFAPAEKRPAEPKLLLDYTTMFADFAKANKNVMPFLPEWAKAELEEDGLEEGGDTEMMVASEVIHVDSDPAETESSPAASTSVAASGFSEDDVLSLQSCLAATTDSNLEAWLAAQIASNPGEVLTAWTKHWETRMGDARSYQEQVIVQSLFRQSLGRLHALDSMEIPALAAVAQLDPVQFPALLSTLYMVVDMKDSHFEEPSEEALSDDTLEFLRALAPFKAYETASDELVLLATVAGVSERRLMRITQSRISVLYSITRESFHIYFWGVIGFETLRTRVVCRMFMQSLVRLNKQVDIMQDHIIEELKLTNWQVLSLLAPGARREQILTSWQLKIFHAKYGQESDSEIADIGQIGPVPTGGQSFRSMLFTNLRKPPVARPTPTPAPMTPAASVSSVAVPTASQSPVANSIKESGSRVASREASRTKTPGSFPASKVAMAQTIESPGQLFGRRTATVTTRVPTKRPGSPLVNTGKAPRLGLIEELKMELRNFKDELLEDIKRQKQASRDSEQRTVEELAGIKADLKSHQESTKAQLSQLGDSMKTQFGFQLGKVTEVMCLLRELRKNVGELDGQLKSLTHPTRQDLDSVATQIHEQATTMHNKLESQVTALQAKLEGQSKEQATMQGKLDTAVAQTNERVQAVQVKLERLGDLHEEIKQVKSLVEDSTPPPQLGELGYLTKHLPAPDGADQRSWEARLLRAFWCYVLILGYEETGLRENLAAFTATQQQFDDIDADTLAVTLRHFHLQVFNTPLLPTDEEDEPDDDDDLLNGLSDALSDGEEEN